MSYDLGTAHGKIELEYNNNNAPRDVDRDMDKINKKSKDTDKGLQKLGKTLSTLGSGARIGLIATGIGAAAVQAAALGIQLLGMIPSLVSIASLTSALPGLFVGVIASVSVLKAAFSGVGDAVKAAFDTQNPDKFQKALDKLSPAAQQFAVSVHNAAPALKAWQKSIQDAFFSSSFLAGQLPRVVKALGTLSPGLIGLTKQFGEITRQVANFVLSADSIDFLNHAVGRFRSIVASVTPAILPILAGLRAVGTIGLPLLGNLSVAVGTVANKFGTWLNAIAADGRLQAWIDTALSTLKTLGDIAKNVGSILFSVIKAAQDVGGGLLGTLKEITGQFAAFLSSAEGSAAIRALFGAILAIAKQLAPVITTLVGALAGALAPALQEIASVVGPVLLQVVNALAPAFGPLAKAIADLVVAVAPLLPPAAKLLALLAQLAAVIASSLSAELGPLIDLLANGLSGAFDQLGPVVDAFASALPIAAAAGIQLAKAFAPLAPAIIQVAQAVAGAIIQNLPQLTQAIIELLPTVIQLATIMAGNLSKALIVIAPLIPPIISGIVSFDVAFFKVYGTILKVVIAITQFAQSLAHIPAMIGSAISSFVTLITNAFKVVQSAVVTGLGVVIAFFTALPGRLITALKALPMLLGNLFISALQAAATAVGFAAGLIVGIFTKLPGRIAAGIAALPGILSKFFIDAWNAAKTISINVSNTIVNFAKTIPTRIRNAVNSLIGLLSGVMRSAFSSMRSAAVGGANSVIGFVRGLPGRLKAAVGNLGSLLYNAGANVINGLIRGIQSGISRVLGMVSDLGHRVRDAFNNALSIFSPSRVFVESGVNIDEGLINGIRKKMGEVSKAAVTLAKTVIDPTISLPTVSGMALAGVSALPAAKSAVAQMSDTPNFGPYHLQIDKDTLVAFTIDAITGNPKVVAAANTEGSRQKAWTGSGRNN
jgi:phage-related protein